MACPRCGAVLPHNATRCTQCGAAVAAAEAPTPVASGGGAPPGAPPTARPTVFAPAASPSAATMVVDGPAGDPAARPSSAGTELIEVVQRELGADYVVEREIGRGGMAVVFQATERELRRPVALKVLPPELAFGASMADRFKREARMAASLDHPNIIPVYRVGQAESTLFIAMKYIEGRALDEVIAAQGALPVPVALLVLRGAADALAYAHDHGIVHRDVKCANILVDREGRPIVSDFGVARAIEDASMTVPGSVIGTPWFMSPEQCGGRGRVGPQSDQYSLGVVAFQMLAGRVPFDAETLAGIMQHHFFTPVPDLRLVRGDVPAALIDVVTRALSKDPKQRYGTTAEMVRAIDAVPFSDADRRWGEAMLRQLALGVSIPAVAAATLPPLQELTRPPAGLALGRSVVPAGMIVAAALAVGVLAWSARADRAAGASAARAATAPAVTPPPAAPTVAPAARVSGGAAAPTVPARLRATGSASPPSDRPRVPPAPADPPPAAPTHALGKLRVRAFPADAEIFIDGQPAGRGLVIDADVRAGVRRLKVTAPGYVTVDTTFTVRAGETAQLGRLTLRTLDASP